MTHMGNWEMVTLAARMHGLPLTVVYRPFNNPFIDALVRGSSGSGVELIMKGREGARRLTQVLKRRWSHNHACGRTHERRIDIPFLGIDAMTPTAPAALALKYDALLVPVRVERMDSARFRLTVEEPRPPVDTGNRNSDIDDDEVDKRTFQRMDYRTSGAVDVVSPPMGKNPKPPV